MTLVLMSLNKLFPVNTIRRKGVGQWRPSRKEIIKGFILHQGNFINKIF